jgi:DNA (cytosine-5)-methyltransferase 1
MKPPKAVSLFSSAGIGELGLERNKIEVIAANEIVAKRCNLYRENHRNVHLFEGDVWKLKEEIVQFVTERLGQEGVFLVYATPPCQGMSTNGVGKLKAEIKAGNRPLEDARNRLIIPAMDIICSLRPQWVLLENVPRMKDVIIRTDDGQSRILDYVSKRLGRDYVGKGEVLSCSDYGIPQIRKRLITVFTRNENGKCYFDSNNGTFFPDHEKTRARTPTLRNAIGSFPPLDAVAGKESCPSFNPLHYVPIMNPEKYWWVSNIKEGDTAYNNQCVNPSCMFQGNKLHVDKLQDGHWQSNKNTPIYCQKCGHLLPRPTIIDPKTKERRLISGFHSAYRRMVWDEPARTLTQNFIYEASDNKIHPNQNRVLSVYEALVIQTIADYDYRWARVGKRMPLAFIAEIIGESVPPKLIDFIAQKIIRITEGRFGTVQTKLLEKEFSKVQKLDWANTQSST